MYQIMKGMNREDIEIILNNYIVKRDERSLKIDHIYREICESTLQGVIKKESSLDEQTQMNIVCAQLTGGSADIIEDMQVAKLLNWKVYYHMVKFREEYLADPKNYLV